MQRRLGLDLEVPDEFGYFLAGFTAGEGCFHARIHHRRINDYKHLVLSYRISLRADDEAILRRIRDTLGVGRLFRKRKQRPSKPQIEYIVQRTADLYHVIVPLFEKYPIPPESKKATDFEIWKQLVEIRYHEGGSHSLGRAPGGKILGHAPLPQSYWDKIEPLVEELKKSRQYADPS